MESSSQGGSSHDRSSLGDHDSRAGSTVAGFSDAGDTGPGASKRGHVVDSLFLYTSAAGRLAFERSWKLQAVFLMYQAVFLGIYAVHPVWGYAFSWNNPIGRWALRIQGHGWATVAGDVKILEGLALCALALTLIHAGLAVHLWSVVRRGKNPHRAELATVRTLEVLYYKLLGLPALGVLLAPLSCNWSGQLAGKTGSNIFLHTSQCAGTLTTVGLAGLAVALLLHAPVYVLLSVKDCELDPATPVPFAGGSMVAVARVETLKVASLFVLHLLTGAVPVLSGILLIFLWTWVTYALSLRVPYFGQGPSIARSVVAGAIAGAFVASTAQRGGWTLAWALLVALAPACGVLAAVATRARIRAASAVIAKFEEIRRNREQTDKRVHRFFDQEDAELLIRVLRQSHSQRIFSRDRVDACAAAVNHATAQFFDSVEVVLANAIAQAYGQQDVYSAQSAVQKARGMRTSMALRFETLTLERDLRQRQSSTSGDSMDWGSYVELQHRLRMLLVAHKKAVETSREVWRAFLKTDPGIDDIADALRRMTKHGAAADAFYRTMVAHHPHYPKLLQMYGKFLEDVQDNTGLAMQVYQQVEKLEDAAEARVEAAAGTGAGGDNVDGIQAANAPSLTNVDEARDSVVVIDAETNLISFTNANMTKLFGYKRGELVGRNVNTLMPQPFSQHHDRYLKTYALTGQPHIMNGVRAVVALHKDGTVFPVTLCVTKISQNGRDGFMGVFRLREVDPDEPVCYLSTSCQVIYANRAFHALTGWSHHDLQAQRSIGVLFPDQDTLRTAMANAAPEATEAHRTAAPTALPVQSKYGENFPASLVATFVGYGDSRLVLLRLARVGEEPLLVVLGPATEIVSYNATFKRLCSQTTKALAGLLVTEVFAHPCSAIYASRLDKTGEDPAQRAAVVDQRVVRMPSKEGIIYVQIFLLSKQLDGDGRPTFTMRFQHLKNGIEKHATIALIVDHQGQVQDVRQHCACAAPGFSFTREGLQGVPVNKVIGIKGPLEAFMTAWAEATADPPFESTPQLVTVRTPDGTARLANAVFGARRDSLGNDGDRVLCLTLSRLDLLNVVLEMADDGTLRAIHGPVHKHVGRRAEVLLCQPLSAIVPGLGGRIHLADDLLVPPGHRRAPSNKRKSVVGPEHFQEQYAGSLGVRLTFQAARMQGTKDEVLALLEATGPHPGPARPPEARAFVAGEDPTEIDDALPGAQRAGEGLVIDAGAGEGARVAEGAAGAVTGGMGGVAKGAESEGETGAGAGEVEEGKVDGMSKAAEGAVDGGSPDDGAKGNVVGGKHGDGDGNGDDESDSDDEGRVPPRGSAYERVREWVEAGGSLDRGSVAMSVGLSATASLTRPGLLQQLSGAANGDAGVEPLTVDAIARLQDSLHLMKAKPSVSGDISRSTAPAEPSPTKPGPEAVAAASPKARGPLADIKREAAKQQRNSSTSSRLGSMFVEESRAPAGTNGGDSGDDGDGADDDGDGGDNEDGNDMDGEIGGEQRRVSIDSGAGKAKGPMSPRARPGQVGEGRGGGGGAGKGDDDEVDEEREGSVAGSAVSDSVVSETGGRGGGAAMVAEDDVPGLDLLEHETAQVRSRKFKRIEALLTSRTVMRPVHATRYVTMAVCLVIFAVQCIAFGLTLSYVRKHTQLSNYVSLAATGMKGIIDIKRYARLLQGLSVGTPIPGGSLETNQAKMSALTASFLDAHNQLYHTATFFTHAPWKSTFRDLWLANDMQVTTMTASSLATGAQLQTTNTNLWECGNTYASNGLTLAKMTEADISQGDIAPLASFQYVKDNGLVILAGRYETLLSALVNATRDNLHTLGVVALVFLAVNLGVVVPAAILAIHGGMAAALRVRAGMMAVLLAVPRALVHEMARRPVNLQGLEELAEDGDEEDAAEANKAAVAGAAGVSVKTLRLLLSQKVDFERVKVARDLVLSRRDKQRSQRVVEAQVVGPFVAWGAVAGVIYGVTWALQSSTAAVFEPSRAGYFMMTYTAKCLCSATDLVVDTVNRLNGSPWATASGSVKDRLRENQLVVQSSVDALIWGNSTFFNGVIPGGTAVYDAHVRAVYFDHQCFSLVSCPPPTDPDWPSTGRGYYALMSRFSDEATALPDDRDVDLTVTNARYTFLQTQGDDSILQAQLRIKVAIESHNNLAVTLVAMHAALLAATAVAGVCYTIWLLQPLHRLLSSEAGRLVHLMAELPKEISVEEVVVALVDEMTSHRQDESVLDLTDTAGADVGRGQGEVRGPAQGDKAAPPAAAKAG